MKNFENSRGVSKTSTKGGDTRESIARNTTREEVGITVRTSLEGKKKRKS